MNKIENENKIEKSIRNSELFKSVLERATKGDFDKELSAAREEGSLAGTATRLPLLKVTEIWTIRKKFSIEKGTDYFQLYKEKFYIENPGSNYADTVSPTVYRDVVAQRETGDAKWAAAVSKHMKIPAELSEAKKPAAKKKTTKKTN